LQVQVGVETQITIIAMDPDMDMLTYSLTNEPTIMQPQGVRINRSE